MFENNGLRVLPPENDTTRHLEFMPKAIHWKGGRWKKPAGILHGGGTLDVKALNKQSGWQVPPPPTPPHDPHPPTF